jgi:glycosyltransferase involved in cell wall biosynthesis
MRVLQLRQSHAVYGPENTILGFSRALPEFGFECRIGLILRKCATVEHPLRAAARVAGISLIEWDGAPTASLELVRQIRAYLVLETIDVIHSHDYKANWAALLASRGLERRPALVSTPRHSEQRRLIRFLQWIDSWWLPRFDRLTEASPSAAAKLAGIEALQGKLRLVRHGFEAWEHAAAQPLPANADGPVVTLVGRLEKVKGHGTFLEAMAIVRREFPRVRIWLAGEGSLRPELEDRARRLGLDVEFLGYRADAGHVLASSSVAVVASEFETSCRVAMEAMHFGCPLVATPVGIVPELARGGAAALLVPVHDAEALAAAVGRVLRDPELAASLREQALASIAAARTHRDAARELAEVYREAISCR